MSPKPTAPLQVLIADDDPVSARLLTRSIESWELEAVAVRNGEEAWKALQNPRFRLALLDWEMPEADGLEVCRRVRAAAGKRYTFIILLTSRDKSEDIIAGLEAGADDYMVKPVKIQELKARLQSGRRIIDLEDRLLRSQKRLFELATKDGLTKLWNRRTILQFLEDELSHGERAGTATSLIMIDVDNFKTINDTCGHQAGDKVLATLSSRLQKQVRPYDRIGRYGGDEILIVLPNCGLSHAAGIAERLRRDAIRKPARFGGQTLGFTLSIGVSSTEDRARPTADKIIQAGDLALYEAKRLGRDRVVRFEPEPARRKGSPPCPRP
ncbi:MAG: diguanylate cyclase [Acidobacteriota bacterium]|nr:diguanylate cyclase [Acidobacteriota bacterium]